MKRKSASDAAPFLFDQIEVVPLAKISEHPRNARQGDVGQIIESIRANGVYKPIIVQRSTGFVLAGNHTLKAMRQLGRTEVAVVYVDVDEERGLRILLADNRSADLASYDETALVSMLQELRPSDAGLAGTGYDDDALNDLIANLEGPLNLGGADEVPETPAVPKTKTGDLYELGEHRLLCGDSTKAEDVERLTGGQKFHAVVTDPPYGIGKKGITNDDESGLGVLFAAVLSVAPLEDAVVIAFQSPRLVGVWLDAIRTAGHHFERFLWLYRRASKTFPWRGWVLASDAIAVSTVGDPKWPDVRADCHDTYVKDQLEPAELTGKHPSIKPTNICADLIRKTPVGPVYEPFAGSGSTLIAAEQAARSCYAMEIDPAYCDVIVARWEKLTGKTATLVRD